MPNTGLYMQTIMSMPKRREMAEKEWCTSAGEEEDGERRKRVKEVQGEGEEGLTTAKRCGGGSKK